MNKIILALGIILFTLTSCDESTGIIGASLDEGADKLKVSDAVFEVSSRSVSSGAVWARSSTGYLGKAKDPESGSYVTSSFMTQFAVLETGQFDETIDEIASRDEDGGIIADSCEVRLFVKGHYGDARALMKLNIHELDHPMTEDQKYFSDFNIFDAGYIRTGGLHESQMYTLVNYADGEEREETGYLENICIKLNGPYTDKNGVTYNNFGTYIMRMYYSHPEYFSSNVLFLDKVLPGFFFEYAGGLGNMAYISSPQINIFFRKYADEDDNDADEDGIVDDYTIFSGTEEVLQTTSVTYDDNSIQSLVDDNTCTYLKSPAGIFTELTLPVEQIVGSHTTDSLSSAKLILNRINNTASDEWTLQPTKYILLIEKDSLSHFFEKSQLPDSKGSFYAGMSINANTYSFDNISTLINKMYKAKKKGLSSDASWLTAHPNWNKVLLIPVSVNFRTVNYGTSSSKILIGITHDLEMSSTKLVGGSTPIQLTAIYSSFN